MVRKVNYEQLLYTYLFPTLIVLFYVIDFMYKLLVIEGHREIRISAFFKFFIFVFFIIFQVYKNKLSVLLISGGILIIWSLGQLVIANNIISTQIFVHFCKYIFFIFFIFFGQKFIVETKQFNLLKNVFEKLILINSVFIFVGFAFDIRIFQTYFYGNRFGYNGLILSSSQASYIYIIALSFFLFGTKWTTSIISFLKLSIVIFAAVLIGTKAIYLFVLFCFLIISLNFFNEYISLLLFCVGALILLIILFSVDSFYNLVERKNILTALLSYRDELLLNQLIPYVQKNWGIINYAFGGMTNLKTKSQLGFVDLFYFLGIIGGGIYFYLFQKLFISFKLNFSNIVLIFGLCMIICFSGNFFYSTSLSIYIFIFQKTIERNPTLNILT